MSGAINSRIEQAQLFLERLGFDPERTNERSARVLLALLALKPQDPWSKATSPLLRTVEIMAWIREHYGHNYKPNTRETIRRRTLHQFAEALLVEQNPDQPDRPVNSPKWCYRVHPLALAVARAYEQPDFEALTQHYLTEVPGLLATYQAAREMNLIPVTLLDGQAVTLSPGGQNLLLKSMIEELCPRYTPGGRVLYVGDAAEKWTIFEAQALAGLGITVDLHGKMPDLVVYIPDRNWLVLMEAASSHGPVDAKRHAELAHLFGGSSAGLIYVSCFPSRAEMRKHLADIAWETDVWCADNPTHLIHFNGERYLGPYSEPG